MKSPQQRVCPRLPTHNLIVSGKTDWLDQGRKPLDQTDLQNQAVRMKSEVFNWDIRGFIHQSFTFWPPPGWPKIGESSQAPSSASSVDDCEACSHEWLWMKHEVVIVGINRRINWIRGQISLQQIHVTWCCVQSSSDRIGSSSGLTTWFRCCWLNVTWCCARSSPDHLSWLPADLGVVGQTSQADQETSSSIAS